MCELGSSRGTGWRKRIRGPECLCPCPLQSCDHISVRISAWLCVYGACWRGSGARRAPMRPEATAPPDVPAWCWTQACFAWGTCRVSLLLASFRTKERLNSGGFSDCCGRRAHGNHRSIESNDGRLSAAMPLCVCAFASQRYRLNGICAPPSARFGWVLMLRLSWCPNNGWCFAKYQVYVRGMLQLVLSRVYRLSSLVLLVHINRCMPVSAASCCR